MSRKQLIVLTMLYVLLGVSLVKSAAELIRGHVTSTLVMPFILAAMLAEQLAPKYTASVRVSAALKTVRVGGVVVALGLLVLTGVRGT